MMDYEKTASLVIKYVGGKNNSKSVTHCATRLRFQLRDNGLRNEEAQWVTDLILFFPPTYLMTRLAVFA